MSGVVVVDYGLGNLLSVTRALEEVGARPVLSSEAAEIRRADRLVLPGVGAFGDGMAGLRERGLVDALMEFSKNERPFLGICLGMQLMMDEGEEFGRRQGLGLIAGRCVRIPADAADGRRRRVPHIGWNALRPSHPSGWGGSALDGLEVGSSVYFVHSFGVEPDDPAQRLAECDYDGVSIVAATRCGMLTGCQFHPEKSGPAGLAVLSRFMAL